MLTLLALGATALADIPPPPGEHWIETQVLFEEGIPDHTLVIYPWSDSDGAPTAEIRVVTLGAAIGFGRRISGVPQLYAVPTSVWSASPFATASPTDATINETTLAFFTEKGLTCDWKHTPSGMGPLSKPATQVERRVARLRQGKCTTYAVGSPMPPADGEPSGSEPKPVEPAQPDAVAPTPTDAGAKSTSDAGCTVLPAPSAFGLLTGLLLAARRRRE